MVTEQNKAKKWFMRAVVGTIVVALCCFTPILVLVLGLVGLRFFLPYLDIVLLPALVVMVIVTVMAYQKWRQSG